MGYRLSLVFFVLLTACATGGASQTGKGGDASVDVKVDVPLKVNAGGTVIDNSEDNRKSNAPALEQE